MTLRFTLLSATAALVFLAAGCRPGGRSSLATFAEDSPGIGYTNQRVATEPWSIHVVRVDRTNPTLTLHSVHAPPGAVGLTPLSSQVGRLPAHWGVTIAGVNGDFYQRDQKFAGDSRGLQIVEGELVSGPNGGVAFWVDARGQPQATHVVSQFQATWPDGSQVPFGLNSERPVDGLVLYTLAIGTSTPSAGGREFVLESVKPGEVALAIGDSIETRVREIRELGDTPLSPGILVLSASPGQAKRLPPMSVGDRIQLSTETIPDLKGARMAIGGGPTLIRQGRPLRINSNSPESYEFSSMLERHPRTAVGWNQEYLYLVTVDGRQETLSVGMTLDELGEYLVGLGCTEAINLDGGGSATLWYGGKVRNSPCDGEERPIANAIVVLRSPKSPPAGSPRESKAGPR